MKTSGAVPLAFVNPFGIFVNITTEYPLVNDFNINVLVIKEIPNFLQFFKIMK